jgi:hypothetical protein
MTPPKPSSTGHSATPVISYSRPGGEPAKPARRWVPSWLAQDVTGHVNKRVRCEKCGAGYLYELRRTAAGHTSLLVLGFVALRVVLPLLLLRPITFIYRIARFSEVIEWGRDEAATQARKRLRKQLLHEVEPVACPDCGWYQRDMVREIRARAYAWTGLVTAALVLSGPIMATALGASQSRIALQAGPAALWMACTVAGIAAAALLLAGRWLAARGIDPHDARAGAGPANPNAPAATREAEHRDRIAAATARLTKARRRAGGG